MQHLIEITKEVLSQGFYYSQPLWGWLSHVLPNALGTFALEELFRFFYKQIKRRNKPLKKAKGELPSDYLEGFVEQLEALRIEHESQDKIQLQTLIILIGEAVKLRMGESKEQIRSSFDAEEELPEDYTDRI